MTRLRGWACARPADVRAGGGGAAAQKQGAQVVGRMLIGQLVLLVLRAGAQVSGEILVLQLLSCSAEVIPSQPRTPGPAVLIKACWVHGRGAQRVLARKPCGAVRAAGCGAHAGQLAAQLLFAVGVVHVPAQLDTRLLQRLARVLHRLIVRRNLDHRQTIT